MADNEYVSTTESEQSQIRKNSEIRVIDVQTILQGAFSLRRWEIIVSYDKLRERCTSVIELVEMTYNPEPVAYNRTTVILFVSIVLARYCNHHRLKGLWVKQIEAKESPYLPVQFFHRPDRKLHP